MPHATEILQQLETLGTEQNRKIYRRHGVTGPQFGLSMADLGKLHKQIKRDHATALELWNSGNHDARLLATMIADPDAVDLILLDEWAHACDNYIITDAVTALASKTHYARRLAEAWNTSDEEWVGAAGWGLIGYLAMNDSSLPDAYFEPYLVTIEREIHQRRNRVRYAMNNTLISIGIRSEPLRENAVATARRIGMVMVDHGETGCKTPDAVSYIARTLEHRQKKAKAR